MLRLHSGGMEPFQSVALLEDIPLDGFVRGQVGAVVDDDHFAVEFVDASGRTYGLTTLTGRQVMPLVHEAVSAV